MSNHILDRHFRQALADQSAEVPSGLWDTIQQQIPSKPQPSRRIWAWIIAGLAVMLAAGAVIVSLSERTASDGANAAVLSTIQPDVTHTPIAEVHTPSTERAEPVPAQQTKRPASPGTPAFMPAASTGKVRVTTTAANAEATSQDIVPENNSSPAQVQQSVNPAGESLASPTTAHKTFAVAFLTESVLNVTHDGTRKIMQTDCYSFGKNSLGNIMLDIYAGPSFATKSMTSRNEDVSDYIVSRDTTEFGRPGFHIGLRAGYQHASGFFARIGVRYTQINERFDYVNGSTSQTIITTDTIFDAQGNIVDIIPDTVMVSGTRIKKTYNRFHTIDIPILVGYQIDYGDWAYGLQAGPVFNVAFDKKGDILAPNGAPGTFSDEQASDYHPVFRDRLGLSIYGSVYAQKRIGEFLYAFVEPHVLHRLKTLTLETYPIDQRQTVIGLSLGLRLKL